MDYAAQTQNIRGTISGGIAGGSAIEQRSFESSLDRMEKELQAIAENVGRVSSFRNRLLNPVPQGVSKDATATPQPGSVEGRLNHLINLAHSIGEHLNEVANVLDRAA